MITVFYDGKCGICSKEIKYYKKIAPFGLFRWHDITKVPQELNDIGVSLSHGLRLLHVKNNNGIVFTGLDAFIIIWKHLKGWRILAIIISFPIINQLANLLYKLFANWRFNRLKHCQVALKKEKALL